MKKLSLMLVFVMLLATLFALSVFAEDKNIASNGTLTSDATHWHVGGRYVYVTDGSYSTGVPSSAKESWNNYLITYDSLASISKVELYVNGSGTAGYYTTFTDFNANTEYYVQMYDENGKQIFSQTQKAGDKQQLTFTLSEPLKVKQVKVAWYCGYNVEAAFLREIEVYGHFCDYTELTTSDADIAAGCETEGVVTYKCANCDSTTTKSVPAIGHNWDTENGVVTVEPTEESEGLRVDSCLNGCGETNDVVLPMLSHVHNYTELVEVTTVANCTTEGVGTYKCSCGETMEGLSVPVDANNHNYTVYAETIVAPTYRTGGTDLYKCEWCNEATTEVATDRLPLPNVVTHAIITPYYEHALTDPSFMIDGNRATGTSVGQFSKDFTFTFDYAEAYEFEKLLFVTNSIGRFNDIYNDSLNWKEMTSKNFDFTVTMYDVDGNEVYKTTLNSIKNANDKQEVIVELSETVFASKIVLSGSQFWDNSIGFWEVETYAYPKSEHTVHEYNVLLETLIEAGCATEGLGNFKCRKCDSTSEVAIPATGNHKYTVEVEGTRVDAKCTENGSVTMKCENCDATEVKTLEALGHTEVASEAKAPTCTETGLTAGSYCSVCNEVLVAQEEVAALGHTKDETVEGVVTAPSCTEKGYTTYTCATCGESYTADETATTGHTWGDLTAIYGSEPTCVAPGKGVYYCDVCYAESEQYDMPIDPKGHNFDSLTFNSAYTFVTCADCKSYYFINEYKGIDTEYIIYISDGSVNIYTEDWSFDEYYGYTEVSVVDGVYTFTLTEDADFPSETFLGASLVISINKNESLYLTLTSGETVYHFGTDPKAKPETNDNALLNGVYQYTDVGGAVSLKVQFLNGTVSILEDNMMLGLPESFNYEYNAAAGMLTDEYGFFSILNGVIYAGRGWELVPVDDEEPDVPDVPEVNYGEQIGSLDVETTDTYGFFDGFTYTAEKAGQYSFLFPAGLGAANVTAGQDVVNYQSNTSGEYVVLTLNAGETVEFAITAATIAEWTIDVYYLEVEVEEPEVETTPLNIGNNPINAADVTYSYTAEANGTLTLSVGSAIMGNVSIVYTVNGGDAQVLELGTSVALNLVAGDKVVITVTAEGYATLNAAWGTPKTELVIGNNSINAADVTYVYTAEEAGKLTLTTGATIMGGNLTFTYTVNDGEAQTLALNSSVTLELEAGDKVEITVIADGDYSSLTAAWEKTAEEHTHTEVEIPAVAPSCTEPGLTAGVQCSECGEIIVAQETVDALGHTEVEIPAVAPSCTEPGLTTGVQCSECGEVITAQETVDALGHSYAESARVESTCSTAGSVTFTCSACGDSYSEALELAAHTEVEIPAVLPTPSVTGMTAGAKCSVCGTTTVEPVENVVTLSPTYKTFGINSTNLILGNNISLDYKVNVSEGYELLYMVFVFEDVEYIVTDYVIDGGKPLFNFAETRPHKMATNVKAYVYAETSDGYSYDVYEYSVMKYCIAKLKKNENVNVISDLLAFGAATQKYVAEMTGTTVADKDLITSLVEAEGYTLTPTAFTSIPESLKAQYVDIDANDDYTWKSASVALGSSTEMVYKFAATDITGLQIRIDVDGVEKMVIDAADLDYDASAKRYVVSVNCVSAVQYGSEVKATFLINGVESDSVAYSINGFLYNNLSKNEGTVLGDLMKALYVYGDTTYKLFYQD